MKPEPFDQAQDDWAMEYPEQELPLAIALRDAEYHGLIQIVPYTGYRLAGNINSVRQLLIRLAEEKQ